MQSSGNKICNILKSMQILKDSINLRNLWNGVERSTDSKKKTYQNYTNFYELNSKDSRNHKSYRKFLT